MWSAAPCVEADDCIGPPLGLVGAAGCIPPSAPGRNVGRAISPAALRLAAPQAFRDDASIVPYETRGKALPCFAGYLRRKAAMHPFVCALRRIHLPLQGRLYQAPATRKAPLQGAAESSAACGGKAVSHTANGRHSFHYRLFGDRKHRTALRSPLRSLPLRGNAAVAERKCASAHAARCGHRKPVTRPQPTEGCRTWPCQYPSGPPQTFPAGVNARPTMQGKRAEGSGTAGMVGG